MHVEIFASPLVFLASRTADLARFGQKGHVVETVLHLD